MRSIISKATKTRGDWGVIKPVTKVKANDKVYNRKKENKSWKKIID